MKFTDLLLISLLLPAFIFASEIFPFKLGSDRFDDDIVKEVTDANQQLLSVARTNNIKSSIVELFEQNTTLNELLQNQDILTFAQERHKQITSMTNVEAAFVAAKKQPNAQQMWETFYTVWGEEVDNLRRKEVPEVKDGVTLKEFLSANAGLQLGETKKAQYCAIYIVGMACFMQQSKQKTRTKSKSSNITTLLTILYHTRLCKITD